MKISLAALAFFAALPLVAPHGSALACDETPQPGIAAGEVNEQLNALLRSEGLPATRAGRGVVRPVDLDGDPATAEALVDVISAEHCFAAACTTLVVRRAADGSLATAGHGTWLMPLKSRTRGWIDLGETAPVLTVRALKFAGTRYQ